MMTADERRRISDKKLEKWVREACRWLRFQAASDIGFVWKDYVPLVRGQIVAIRAEQRRRQAAAQLREDLRRMKEALK